MNSNLNIMDVTCRDGSYVSNFQMSISEQKNICKGLQELGIKYIEIGHGMGIGASRNSRYQALHSDEEYLKCAQECLNESKYGVFCIPGIASVDDVKRAADLGCSFIRIGCNVEDINLAEKYIVEADAQGMYVMSNYMKSYASSTYEIQEAVKKSQEWGSKLIYLVDSAGSMLPSDLTRYYEAIKDVSNLKIGFHGHNNIGMALTNSLHCVKLGVDFIDCSLQGLGRSAGNTVLEHFVICMQKMGATFEIDEIKMLLLSKKYVYPLIRAKGFNPIDLGCGIAGFHSSYLQVIHELAAKYEVNPLVLINEYCKVDQVNMNKAEAEKIARNLEKDFESFYLCDFANYFGCEQ